MPDTILASEIKAKCSRVHARTEGVLPPSVCPYCMGCPIGTLVLGVEGKRQGGPLPIPSDSVDEVKAWAAEEE